jgi:hypothetical protein
VPSPNEPPAPSSQVPPSTYFYSLEITDVRCFAGHHKLALSDGHDRPAQWTLLLGENGVGKTTLLELLESLRPTLTGPSQHEAHPTTPCVPELLHTSGMRAAFDVFRRSDDLRWKFTLGLSLLSQGLAPSSHQDLDYISGELGIRDGHCDARDATRRTITYGYGATRRVAAEPPGRTPASDSASLLLSDAAYLQDPERWFIDAVTSANLESPHQERAKAQLERIGEILPRVLPDVKSVQVRSTERAGRIAPVLEVLGPDGWVPYASLSLGYRTMTAWMVDLAIRLFHRYPDLKDPLTGGAICLIDEIDLHLHPRWQRSLIGEVSKIFPNVQFIATAHSPLMVQSATNANVVVLRREDGRIVIDNDPPNVAKWRVDQILTSQLFGLKSARSPELDDAMSKRDTILAKPDLSPQDEARLSELSKIIGDLPYGETPEDIEASNTIRLAAKSLKKAP